MHGLAHGGLTNPISNIFPGAATYYRDQLKLGQLSTVHRNAYSISAVHTGNFTFRTRNPLRRTPANLKPH